MKTVYIYINISLNYFYNKKFYTKIFRTILNTQFMIKTFYYPTDAQI